MLLYTIRRLGRVALSLALLLIILSACASQESEPSESIVLIFACRHSELSVYQAAAETFSRFNPSVVVHVIPLDDMIPLPPEDETDTLRLARQLALHADTFLWSTGGVEGGPTGLVLDLTPFIEDDGEPTEDDFLPGLLDHFQWQGGTWGLPAGVDPLFILYDQAAFDAAGLEHPFPGWSWDDLFDAAQQLTQWEGDRVVRYGFADFGLQSVRSSVEAQGGRLVDDSAQSPVPTLDDPRTLAAVDRYADLALTQGVMANPAREGFVDAFDVVRRGEAAMSVNPARFWVDTRHYDSGKLGVAPLPGRSPVWLYGYFVSAGTAHPEDAWRWLRFLSREVSPPNRLPAHRRLIPDSAYAATAGEEAMAAFHYAAEHTLSPVRPVAVEILLEQAVKRILEGKETEDALAEAQRQALSLPTPAEVEPFTVSHSPPTQANVETITFIVFDYREYAPLADVFHETHPEIEVVIREAIDFEYHGAGPPTEMIAASGTDCFLSTTPASTSPEMRQAVLDLQPFIDADPTFSPDDYEPRALEAVRYGGDLWGLPAGLWVNDVLWYNRTLFDEAGLPYPTSDWSWDDLFLTARKISGEEKGHRRYGFIIWPDLYDVALLKVIGGEPPVDEKATPLFRLDAPNVVAAAWQLAALVQDEIVPRQTEEGNNQDLFSLIYANRVGMWIGPARTFEHKDYDFRPASLPESGRCLNVPAVSAYYIAVDTPHTQACWEWLHFLSERIPDNGELPPRHSLLTSEAFREQVGAEAQAVYLETLECEERGELRGLESLPPYAGRAIHPWLDQALGEILWHGADAQVALNQAQWKAEAYLNCLRQRPDLEDQASAEACFQEVNAP